MTLHFECETARRTVSLDAQGKAFEAYWLGNHFIFENQITNTASYTRTHPGWVMADNRYCTWEGTPPPRFDQPAAAAPTSTAETVSKEIAPVTAQTLPPAGDSSGAALLMLGIVASAIYAAFQWKNGKEDFSDDYHPMDDAPGLPTAYTDEDLDTVYDRPKYPQYQGIREPSPWQSTQVYPRTEPAEPVSEPGVHQFSEPVREPVQLDRQAARESFELSVLPAPRNGYFLGEESLLSHGQAYQLVSTALELGYSKNWMAENLFKVSKGANKKYQLLSQLVDKVKGGQL